jgi:hypothetical protein
MQAFAALYRSRLMMPIHHIPGYTCCACVDILCVQVMVANIRCGEIARDQLAALTSDQAWQALAAEACGGAGAPLEGEEGSGVSGTASLPPLVHGFNARLTTLVDSCIAG